MSILPEKLKSYDYYLAKLPLFLRQSKTFPEHFRIWFELISGKVDGKSGIIDCGDFILHLLDIFDKDFLKTINDLDGSQDENNEYTSSDILDKLAALFGLTRRFSVSYIDDEEVEHNNEELFLTNEDLLILIKTQIIKNFCDGTMQQIESFYKAVGLNVLVITTKYNATAHIYLAELENSEAYSDNIRKMFLAGLFRINNLGIRYINKYKILRGFLEWDTAPTEKQGWDRGIWAE